MRSNRLPLLLAATALGLGAASIMLGQARAADLPSRKAAPAIPAPTVAPWDGFYAGVSAGYVWDASPSMQLSAYQTGFSSTTLNPVYAPYGWAAGATAYLNNSGGVFGGNAGYNKTFGNFLVGVEGNFETPLGGNGKSVTFPTAPLVIPGALPTIAQIGTDWKFAFGGTGRVGYLITPTWLVYAKGGLAALQTGSSVTGGSATSIAYGYGSTAPLWVGYQVGGGVEWMTGLPGWSVKAEYLYENFGSHNVAAAGLQYGATPAIFSTVQTQYLGHKTFAENKVAIGLTYHFSALFGSPTLPTFTGNLTTDAATLQGNLATFNTQGNAKVQSDIANLQSSLNSVVGGGQLH